MVPRPFLSPEILIVIIVLSLASPTLAFGAGYVSPGSHHKANRFRHGDIALAAPLLATANRRLVKQIYFGNWLRDFSQILDKGSIALVPRPILTALVAVFAFLQFGYSTREFEVTSERLGLYRPEEHVDNPRSCDDGVASLERPSKPTAAKDDADGYRVSEGLRSAVHPAELAIDAQTGMKNYIANASEVGRVNPTSADYVEKQLIAAIACGRQGDEEAYVHLGAALHTLEDFAAHSNYVELAMRLIGSEIQDQANLIKYTPAMRNVFTFVGGAATAQTARGPGPPIVTGTFGALDLYQTLLGEVEDKLSAVSLPGLELRSPEDSGPMQTVAKQLIGLFKGLTPSFETSILKIQKTASQSSKDQSSWNAVNAKPEKLWESLEPVLKLRDDVVKWVYDHLAVKAVQEALAAISTAIDKLVFLVLGLVLRPLLPELKRRLKDQELRLLREDQHSRLAKGEATIFDAGSTATDPTHSQLAKDHYDHPLNEVAGRVAVRMSSYAISEVVQFWQPGNTIDPRSSIRSILEVFHHPFNCGLGFKDSSPVQTQMLDEVRSYVRTSFKANPQAFESMLESLSLRAIASRMDVHAGVPVGHIHGSSNGEAKSQEASASIGSPMAQRLSDSIQRQLKAGSIKNLGLSALPGIKELLFASPSADSPNPLDAGLAKAPGISFLDTFRGIGVGEIAATDGMGETLKDAVISMILLDESRAAQEEDVAAVRFGGWGSDVKDEEAKARLKELRTLLNVKGAETQEAKSQLNESRSAAVKEKLSAGVEKLKLKAGSTS